MKGKRVYTYTPVGLDRWRPCNPDRLKAGARVVKCRPHGCPKNGTMGHCFVEDAETGEFMGLIMTASLQLHPGKRFDVGTQTWVAGKGGAESAESGHDNPGGHDLAGQIVAEFTKGGAE